MFYVMLMSWWSCIDPKQKVEYTGWLVKEVRNQVPTLKKLEWLRGIN
jgi:hypothetical protein